MAFQARIWIGSLTLVLTTVAALSGLGWYKYQGMMAAKSAPPPPEAPIAVVVSPVEMLDFRASSTMIGTIMAPRSISMSNEVAGTVREVAFVPGGVVEADQVLVRLDSSVEEARLEAAKARRRLAESTLKRLRSIKGADAISQIELDEALARKDEATAEVQELTSIIGRLTIKAPFRARVGLSDTHVGQYLPSGTMITTLQSLDGFLLVDFMLPQEVADVVKSGDSVRLEGASGSHSAKVIAFNSIADRNTRNMEARARIDNPPEEFQPGDSTRVVVEYGPARRTTAIPVQALRRSPSGALVYLAEPDAQGNLRARARSIIPGPSTGSLVRVLDGIAPNDRVVADGSFKLRDGALIVDVASSPAADPTTSAGTAAPAQPSPATESSS